MNVPGRKYFATEVVWSDWFPRGGDNMIVRAQAIDNNGTVDLDVAVFTKNSDDPGPGSAVKNSSSPVVLSVARATRTVQEVIVTSSATEGCEEMVRYKLSAASTGEPGADEWVMVRLFPPIFYDTAV